MRSLIEARPGVFTEIADAHLLATQRIPEGTEIETGPALPVSCMFDVSFALVAGQRVGFLFRSRFEVENGGSYLMTYMRNKGVATVSETLIKDEHLVIFNYPNKGTLAISPMVNPEIEIILQEQ